MAEKRSGNGADWCNPGSQLERLVRAMSLYTAISLTAKEGDSFNFCPWSKKFWCDQGMEHPSLTFSWGNQL